jgi:hypothetical protein
MGFIKNIVGLFMGTTKITITQKHNNVQGVITSGDIVGGEIVTTHEVTHNSPYGRNQITVVGRRIFANGKLIETIPDDERTVSIKLEGDLCDLECTEVNMVGNVHGDVNSTGANITGDVGGNVDATSVKCGNVAGSVDGTTINCGSVGGDVDGTTVNVQGTVEGYVDGNTVICGNANGAITADSVTFKR